jgi:hypothetical protein
MDRKALEAVLARRIERRYSKEEVLEYYVNRITSVPASTHRSGRPGLLWQASSRPYPREGALLAG